jgi:hypothetical protein
MLNIELKEEVILLNFKKKTLKFNYGKNKKWHFILYTI